ncbi:secreted protein [Melampsora americana]|nr:secreted protein [Melampsora americana]
MRRSSAIFLFPIVTLVQSLIGAPATFSERSTQLVASSTKEIESTIWEYGLTPQVVGQYAFDNGLSAWGKECTEGSGFGCTPYGYSASCFLHDCACVPGGYSEAVSNLNLALRGLYSMQVELKSQMDHKENVIQKEFRMIEYLVLSASQADAHSITHESLFS